MVTNTASLTIGIRNKDQAPYTQFFRCFQRTARNNSYVFAPLKSPICRYSPGFGVEILFILLEALNLGKSTNIEFIGATGWGSMPDRRGLVDLAHTGIIDFTIPQVVITPERSAVASFASATIIQAGSCFLVCDPKHFVEVHYDGIMVLFIGPLASKLWILSITVLLLMRRVLLAIGSRKCGLKFDGATFQRAMDDFEDLFVVTLMSTAFLSGYISAGLIRAFSPKREFPFKDVKHLADNIEQENCNLVLSSKSSSATEQLLSSRVYGPIRKVLDLQKIQYIGDGIIMRYNKAQKRAGKRIVAFTTFRGAHAYMSANQHSMDCMCSQLDAESISFAGGIAVNPQKHRLVEKIALIVAKLRRHGILQRLHHKYRVPGAKFLDTERLLNEGLREVPVLFMVPAKVFLIPLALTAAVYFTSLLILFAEIRIHRLSRYSRGRSVGTAVVGLTRSEDFLNSSRL